MTNLSRVTARIVAEKEAAKAKAAEATKKAAAKRAATKRAAAKKKAAAAKADDLVQGEDGLTTKVIQTDSAKRAALRASAAWDKALAALPAAANTADELAWVRCHPKMMERDRNPLAGHVKITHRDISQSSAGPAPSRAAVQLLQHYCNRPEEFFKQMLSVQKKVAETSEAESEVPEGVEDIDALLYTIEGAIRVQ